MAALRRTAQIQRAVKSLFVKERGISSSAVLQAGWNKDWMPDSYPKTEAEKRASAKKYGFLSEDYKPMADDGDAHGDYPDLPLVGEEQKSPYEDWDDPVMKRNFGEPMHLYYESMVTDKGDPGRVYRYSPGFMLFCFLMVATLFAGPWFLSMPYSLSNSKYNDWYPYEHVGRYKRRQPLPCGERQIHYTFEPAE
ncbi:NADH dehydrogenase [ubiquinone] 1 beta subcomplex subunit 8, mitochondrial-like [Mercenaria mercenaria]|uniref:NADH dehydrogenase [ubiquinone] 1 beta subcomplex subunit 8, mitochondrial-like n=1 Tax=Mercenaria mercenaria TaxID=6596 RepID=UPI00234F630C|nr:NADH dehydrogenase [ubiquinone] 1 beta subcomplex subunit 8, mitochondrial-like [Mercenaria mercenaria]